MRPHRRSLGAALALAATIVAAVMAGPVAAADFPPSDSRYHTYNEMVAEVTAVATAHPDIVSLFSIGKTYKGRDDLGRQGQRRGGHR